MQGLSNISNSTSAIDYFKRKGIKSYDNDYVNRKINTFNKIQ